MPEKQADNWPLRKTLIASRSGFCIVFPSKNGRFAVQLVLGSQFPAV